jgi:sec-independent protein translocase protein TatA
MPNLGFGEILVILILALLIFGPRRLPEMGRTIGRSLREFRRAASDLRAEIEDDIEEEPPLVPSPPAHRERPPQPSGEPPGAEGPDATDGSDNGGPRPR